MNYLINLYVLMQSTIKLIVLLLNRKTHKK